MHRGMDASSSTTNRRQTMTNPETLSDEWQDYERQVSALEAEGMSRSDAQGIIDMQDEQAGRDRTIPERTYTCGTCGTTTTEYMEEYHSMGIYAGRYCSEKCWRGSGYRDCGSEGFDPSYAGEAYGAEDY
jgi:hypothetical protein